VTPEDRVTEPTACPTIAPPLRGDPEALFAASAPLILRQAWTGTMPREGGRARIGAAPEGLAFFVEFDDSHIFSEATADQQKMWTLGDVAELFIKPGGERSDYWEIHITPNDFLMDIHIPDRERFMAREITWDEVIAPDSGTRRRVVVEQGRWTVEALVPWAAFGLSAAPVAGAVWQVAVCRYNCTGDLETRELSSTAAFTQPGFHRWEEFTDLIF
jgi:hypothetical protein